MPRLPFLLFPVWYSFWETRNSWALNIKCNRYNLAESEWLLVDEIIAWFAPRIKKRPVKEVLEQHMSIMLIHHVTGYQVHSVWGMHEDNGKLSIKNGWHGYQVWLTKDKDKHKYSTITWQAHGWHKNNSCFCPYFKTITNRLCFVQQNIWKYFRHLW